MQKTGETTAKFRGLPDMAGLIDAKATGAVITGRVMKMAWQGSKCVEMLCDWVPVELKIQNIKSSPTNKRAYSVWVKIAADTVTGQMLAGFEDDGGLARWTKGVKVELEYNPEESEHYLVGTF